MLFRQWADFLKDQGRLTDQPACLMLFVGQWPIFIASTLGKFLLEGWH